ncbi:MAG TPA: efflux RND transporter permease subunit [Chitinispirillaceae bacterium]|nr:efflux RND transporter permease subunit [Chitinispirillaceae bacterium]
MNIIDRIIAFCIDNKLVTALIAASIIICGIIVAPFDWDIPWISRNPVAVDAIPDIGENQQIVYTDWMGRSPQDVENQITYPLTVSLLGIPGVKSVRSFSMFGFSTIYVIFKENVEFYWSRTRILEKLSSLPPGLLPSGAKPMLGPDATALGQVFWYTLEGRDEKGNVTGGWDLQELRSTQDWLVRYALSSAEGVSEVASVGGFVKEYQIDVDPAAMRANEIMIDQVYEAVRKSNIDVGARTIEINKVEYMIRGLGFLKNVSDIENAVVSERSNTPIRIRDVAKVCIGPALRTGVLDKEGTEAVGGVVVTRFGSNPLAVIKNVKKKIDEISNGLPSKTLSDGTVSKVTIVPFYDRTNLIHETLGTLNDSIFEEILITVLVILIMVNHLGSSVLISSVLPVAVLMSFIGMKLFHVDANIVSLSGIAIAIGTIVDMGIILVENTMKHLESAPPGEKVRNVVFRAASEVSSAILAAVSTTIISFLPVFTMEAAEGKLFKPLAYTKTFALASSIIVALTLVPPLAHVMFTKKRFSRFFARMIHIVIGFAGIFLMIKVAWWVGLIILFMSIRSLANEFLNDTWKKWLPIMLNAVVILVIGLLLTEEWLPMGAQKHFLINLLFVVISIGGLMFFFRMFEQHYAKALAWILDNKAIFLIPLLIFILLGSSIWLGFNRTFFFLPQFVKQLPPVAFIGHKFPGLGKEFMPPLDEGSFLLMPTTMTHASLGVANDIIKLQNMRIRQIPEIENVVGKIGRVESALDPAPTSMFETVITVKPEYILDKDGRRILFEYDRKKNEFARDSSDNLISIQRGRPFRQWRPEIKNMNDIWKEIIQAADVPGVTSAPKLQPIAARVVMLQSGMRAPMGIKVKGADLQTIEDFGVKLEQLLKEVPAIEPGTIIADRIVGKPYFEIEIDRDAVARYGLSIDDVQMVITVAIGGEPITTTVEGRERYGVRARYPRELRNDPDAIRRIAVPTKSGAQIPLGQLAHISYRRGPQMIRAEETFLTSYVLFDKKDGWAEVDVVRNAEEFLKEKLKIGELVLPAGVSYAFAGSYENQVRSEKKLAVVLPLALFAIFLILYFQFKHISTTSLVFSGILVAWAGGFLLIWLYGQQWFMDFQFFGINIRDMFQMHQINLSVAIWVGFLALFGIASDDAVVMCTYLDQRFADATPSGIKEIRRMTVEAAQRRVRPALMTSATTILALLPILTSVGRGSDVMVPMAIPSFGGMCFELLTIFQAPVLYCLLKEHNLKRQKKRDKEIQQQS